MARSRRRRTLIDGERAGGPPLRLVVFDLDGTLIDGYAAIGDALAFALERLGLPPVPPDRVRRMVGHGLETLLAKAAGPERAAEGVRLFRRRYPEVAVEKTDLLPRVSGTLAALAERDLALAVASNKPPEFSRMILDAKGVGGYFGAVFGPEPGIPAKPDPAMLEEAMRRFSAVPSATLAVGDMEVDAVFARAAGCAVVLVPKGSRTRAELESAGADALLDDLSELPAWIDARGTAPTTR